MVGTDVTDVLANTTSVNLLAGKAMEFLNENSVVRLFAAAAAVGIFVTLMIGDSVLVDDQEISGANRFPIKPDDLVDEGAGFAGDRLILRARNSTGADLITKTRVEVEPLGG